MKKKFPLNLLRVTPGRAALIIWASGLLLLALCSLWAMREDREAARERLAVQARNTAVQLSALLAVPAWDVDDLAARTIVMAAMEDERIYAVKVQTPQGMLEGQRRNYQWEPVPWDDEMAEDAVAGLSPLRVEGRPVGTVQVYIAPRESREETALAARRELWRFVLSGVLWTAALAAVFRLRRARRPENGQATGLFPVAAGAEVPQSEGAPSVPQPRLSEAAEQTEVFPCTVAVDAPGSGDGESLEPLLPNTAGEIVSPALGLAFMRRHDHAWLVAAGLFRYSFAHAPSLMSRLYEEGDSTALCRLGYLLEKAAPCLGAERLTGAAKAMQTALHGPDGLRATLAVEECVLALDEVLDSLR